MFHAAYAHGIRPTELSPSRNPYPSRGLLLPCGRVPRPFAPAVIPGPPSRSGVLRSRRGGSPSRGASSFSDSPTTLLFCRRPARPLARLLIRAASPPAPLRPFGLVVGNQCNAAWNRAAAELLAGVRSTSAPKLCSSWKSVHVAERMPFRRRPMLSWASPLWSFPSPRAGPGLLGQR